MTTTGISSGEREIENEATALRASLRGELLLPHDPTYDDARLVWNGIIDRRPLAIARCAGVGDVVEALAFARAHELPVAVRGGGHNVAGNAVCDDGLVIDLSPMKGIRVDPAARTVRAEAGCTLGDLDRETQVFGLAAPLGVVSRTGIAGLTLAGGIGWLRRAHGLSSDNLVSVDVVTADGRLVTASETEHADLFWGVRGGGGNFGIVTSFEYRLHPVGPEVEVCFVLYPGERAVEILQAVDSLMATAPDGLAPIGVLGRVPHADAFPEEAHGRPYAAVLAVYAGDRVEGERVTAPLRQLGDPIADLSGPMSYREAQALLDEDYPDGMLYYWKSADLEALDDDVLARLVARAEAAPSHHSTIDVWFHGGAMSRVDPAATAFGARPAYLIGVEANWEDAAAADENVTWARGTVDELAAFSSGRGYLNFPGFYEEGEAQLRSSYGEENYARLVALKGAWDPDNVFRLNGNVAPTA